MNNWPQYLMASILFARFIVHLVSDGKEESRREIAASVAASLFVLWCSIFILQQGGFWAPIGWPS